MVLTAAQATAFFTGANQMGLDARTRTHFATEGIVNVEDLAEFTEADTWKQIVENCRRPPKIPNADGVLQEQQAYHLGAKSIHRLQVAAQAVKYYQDVDRPISAAAMQWTGALSNFETQWKALKTAKADDDAPLPSMSKTVGIVKFLEAYENYSMHKVGVRNAPIAYVIRESEVVPAAPALATGQPHSAEHGSIKDEMIARLSHQHALFRDDNAAVYDDLEEATRGTKYAASIASFKRSKDGRGAFLALKAQYAGAAMWDAEVKKCEDFILNRKFTGNTSMSLERFISQHRSAYVTLARCAEHVPVELPNERTRVTRLLENIDCADKDVTAAVSSIRLDDGPDGLRSDFERAVAFLAPTDPVTKNRKGKREHGEISSADVKLSRGPETGVELRYYTDAEYDKLSTEEQDELRELRRSKSPKKRKSNSDGKPPKRPGKSPSKKAANRAKFRASVVQAVKKQLLEEEEKKSAAIEAIGGILKNSYGSVASATSALKKVTISEPAKGTAKTERVNEDSQCEVAAAKLYGIIESMSQTKKSTRKGTGGKGTQGS